MCARDAARRQWRQITRFDWQQLRHPAGVGSWPLPVRLFVLMLFTVLLFGTAGALSVWLAPGAGSAERLGIGVLQDDIHARRLGHLQAATEQLELTRRRFWLRPLLQQGLAAGDITYTMESVRAAAVLADVQLLSAVPAFVAAEQRMQVSVQARLLLSSLPAFWRALSELGLPVSVQELELAATEKPDIFALDMVLTWLAPPSSAWAAQLPPPPTAPMHSRVSAGEVTKNTPAYSQHKGFLLRTGTERSQFVYLVRDEHGKLKGVTAPGDAVGATK